MREDHKKYIEQSIPECFIKILLIDVIEDKVYEYKYKDNSYYLSEEKAYTDYIVTLDDRLHPEDRNAFFNNINDSSIESVRFEFRLKDKAGNYDWHSNVIKHFYESNKTITAVLVQDINENIQEENKDLAIIDKLQRKEKLVFDSVSDSIIKLNSVLNINASSNNPEIRSTTTYINNIINDLISKFPELTTALSQNMINNTNEGTKSILVVDDDNISCNLLKKTFESDYKILIANDGQQAIDILKQNMENKDVTEKDRIVGIFLDLNMPNVDGFEVLDFMSTKNLISRIPIIIISGDYDQETKNKAYLYPIADVLEKPFNVTVVKRRIKTLIKLYKSNNLLNEIVLTQHQNIKNVLNTTVKSYIYDNANDINKVKKYVEVLAKQVSDDYYEYNFDILKLDKMAEASVYYNIGRYVLPKKMFQKQTFSEEETKILRSHPFVGLTIYDSVLYRPTDRFFNHFTKEIIEYHEENYNGSGYPLGIKEDQIPISAQIARVCIDYVEECKIMNETSAFEEIVKKSGTLYNPKVIESLKKCIKEFN